MPKYTIEVEKELVYYFRKIYDIDSVEIMLSKMLRLLKEILETAKN